jgi:hypothetical protein
LTGTAGRRLGDAAVPRDPDREVDRNALSVFLESGTMAIVLPVIARWRPPVRQQAAADGAAPSPSAPDHVSRHVRSPRAAEVRGYHVVMGNHDKPKCVCWRHLPWTTCTASSPSASLFLALRACLARGFVWACIGFGNRMSARSCCTMRSDRRCRPPILAASQP